MTLTLLFILVLVGGVAAFAVTQMPDEFSVTRTATMSAPAEKIFAQVNDLGKWDAWSPWAKLDPSAKNTFEGPIAGKDASMKWEGNMKVGVGRMTITDSRPGESVTFRLEFEKPMKATNTAQFTFKPAGGQTTVTWSMEGKNKLMGKIMSLFMNCDKMVGGQFEQGLSNLKKIVEA